jgi:hypothetical protein
VARLFIGLAGAVAATLIGVFGASMLLKQPIGGLVDALEERTPSELLRYAERRLEGHPRLQVGALPLLHALRSRVEREPADAALPSLGKGARERRLAAVRYDAEGRPQPIVDAAAPAPAEPGPDVVVGTAEELARAIEAAGAGRIIELKPGRYRIERRIETRAAGTPLEPIVVRAARLGEAVVEFADRGGFIVSRPYWIFEQLVIRGDCASDADCEHAFPVVGAARATVLRNNRIEDFDAQVKVNGVGDDWPDDGLLQFNSLVDHRPRAGGMPVTKIDIVGASRWQVLDNLIAGFVKAEGDGISYGVFMKGAGQGGRIERNLIVCTPSGVSRPGLRVGLSFGGGTTGATFCRDRRCDAEHYDGRAVNNVIAHCNDFGIDVNRSLRTLVAHNTLVNSAGIDVRGAPASARVQANLLDGRIRARDGAEVEREANQVASLPHVLEAPDALRLDWAVLPEPIAALPEVTLDFCALPRGPITRVGAASGQADCR